MLSLFLFFEGRPKASRRVSVSGPGRGPQGAGDRPCEFGRRGRQSVSSDLTERPQCDVLYLQCGHQPPGSNLPGRARWRKFGGGGEQEPPLGCACCGHAEVQHPSHLVLLCHVAVSLRLTSETSSLPTPRAAPKSHASCKRQRERCPVVIKTPDTLHPD